MILQWFCALERFGEGQMQKFIRSIAILICLGACASKAEKAKQHEDVEALRGKIKPGNLVEIQDPAGSTAKIYVFLGVAEFIGGEPEVSICDAKGFCPRLPLVEFQGRLLEVIKDGDDDFLTSVRRYLTNVTLKD